MSPSVMSLAETNQIIAHLVLFASSAKKKSGNQPTLARELILLVVDVGVGQSFVAGRLQFKDETEIGACVL